MTEVVLGVTFKAISGLNSASLLDLWRKSGLSREFPGVQEQPTYIPAIERFEAKPSAGMVLQFNELGTPRFWFTSKDGREVVQLQRDWFACNWRKETPASQYDRWEARRTTFEHYFQGVERAIRRMKLGGMVAVQCEVTYVNHIPVARHSDLGKVLRLIRPQQKGFLPAPESLRFGASYLIREGKAQPKGRLHIEAQPGFQVGDNAPLFAVNLTARGKPLGDGTKGILAFMDLGREWIVRGFADVTTNDMQEAWGRRA